MDPRLAAIEKRLAGVGRILAVGGGKGGIGKSSVASVLALLLADDGLRAGLLDLDLTGPSDHVILGLDDRFPSEEFGIEPPRLHGIAFMSVQYFLRDAPAALRGADVSNALLELLAITRWGDLDVLVIDLPPGLGDTLLDAVRWIPRAELLAVAGSSRVVLETVRRTLRLLAELPSPVAGVVENMRRDEAGPTEAVRSLAREFDVPWLGALPFDEELEAANGQVDRLRSTAFAGALRKLKDRLLTRPA